MTLSRTGDKVGTTRPQATIGVQGTSSLARSSRAGWPVQVEPGRAPQSAKLPIETRCPPRVSIKTNKKERPSLRTVFPEIAPSADGAFVFILVDSGQKTGIKRGFRRLRTAARLRAWTAPGLRPGPDCRLRAGLARCFFPHTYRKTIPIIAIQIHMGME